MEVRIGVTYSPRELEVDLGDDASGDGIAEQVEQQLAKGGVLWLTDKKGRRIGIPVDKVAYVEIGSPKDDRKVGFGLG